MRSSGTLEPFSDWTLHERCWGEEERGERTKEEQADRISTALRQWPQGADLREHRQLWALSGRHERHQVTQWQGLCRNINICSASFSIWVPVRESFSVGSGSSGLPMPTAEGRGVGWREHPWVLLPSAFESNALAGSALTWAGLLVHSHGHLLSSSQCWGWPGPPGSITMAGHTPERATRELWKDKVYYSQILGGTSRASRWGPGWPGQGERRGNRAGVLPYWGQV